MNTTQGSDNRARLDTDFAWTRRQREVLDRIAEGKSNQQIADELGISLDGAKWHMREILSKLSAETREDAAEYWRLYNGWKPRLARAFRGIPGPLPLKWAAASGAVIVLGLSAIAVYAAFSGDEERQAGEPVEGTATATGTTSATATSSPAPTPLPTVAAIVPRTVTLDTRPQPQPAETTRVLGTPPDSVFPPWDGMSAVIYEIARGTAIDLGPGAQPAIFSPDGTKAVWTVGPGFAQGREAMLIDLATGTRTSLGPARIAGFSDDGGVVVSVGNDQFAVDPSTGQRAPTESTNFIQFVPGPFPPAGFAIDPSGYTSPDVRLYTVTETASGQVVLTFEAVAAASAGPGELAVVAPPTDGRSNVFIVDIATGAATFVATAVPGVNNFPLSANSEAILWTDGYCGDEPGMVTLFDRAGKTLTRLDFSAVARAVDARWARLVPGGQIGVGAFGEAFLIDPQTLAYTAVIPPRPDGYGGDISWSEDYRYASHGPYGGHGGQC